MAGANFTVSMVLRAVNQMSPIIQQTTRQLRQLQTQIDQLNATSNKGTWFDRAITNVDKFQGKIKTAQDAMDKLVKSGTHDIITGGIMALPLVGAIKSAMNVQDTQTQLSMAGLTDKQIGTLTSQAQQTMRKTRFNTGQILGIDQALTQVGMNYQKIQNVGTTSTYLSELEANRNGADPQTTAKQFAQMAEQLQISMNPDKVKTLADQVNRISTVTSASVATLSDSSRYFNLVGTIQGLTPSDIMLTQGLAARYGLEGSIGGTNLKDFFERLNPMLHMNTMMGKPIVNAFASMGWLKGVKYDNKGNVAGISGDVFHDSKGNLVGADQIFSVIAQTYRHMGNKEQFNGLMTRIFGQQGQSIASAVAQNPQYFALLQQQMSQVPTMDQGIAKNQQKGSQQWTTFVSTLGDFGRQIGTMLLPSLTSDLKQLNAEMPKLQSFIDKHKGLIKSLAEIWGALAAFKIGSGVAKIAIGAPMREVFGAARFGAGAIKDGLKLGNGIQTTATAFKAFKGTDKLFTVLWTSLELGFPKLATLRTTLTSVGSGILRMAGFIARISGLTKVWAGIQWLINVAMDANPIGIVIVAIAGLITAIVLVVTHWKTCVTWLKEAWNWFKHLGTGAQIAIAAISPLIGLPLLITAHWKQIAFFFDGIWKHIQPVIKGVGDFLSGNDNPSTSPVMSRFGPGVGGPLAARSGNTSLTINHTFNVQTSDPKQAASEIQKKQDKYYQSRFPVVTPG